jgi:serine/threonine protein kinase
VSEASPTSLDSIYKILMPKHSKYPGLKTTTTFFLHIVEAVCHLHENGICHRDINLKNILVDSFDPPCARLTDFGCATVEDIMKFDTPIGTLLYAAPEQVPGKTYTRAVDYWALGLVGCQLQGLRLEALGVERIMPSQGQLSRIHEVLQKPRLDGNTFVECTRQLLVVDPKKRLMAKDAIEPLQAYIKELEEGEERH